MFWRAHHNRSHRLQIQNAAYYMKHSPAVLIKFISLLSLRRSPWPRSISGHLQFGTLLAKVPQLFPAGQNLAQTWAILFSEIPIPIPTKNIDQKIMARSNAQSLANADKNMNGLAFLGGFPHHLRIVISSSFVQEIIFTIKIKLFLFGKPFLDTSVDQIWREDAFLGLPNWLHYGEKCREYRSTIFS